MKIIFSSGGTVVDNTLITKKKKKRQKERGRNMTRMKKNFSSAGKLSGAPERKIWFIFSILTMVYIELKRVYIGVNGAVIREKENIQICDEY